MAPEVALVRSARDPQRAVVIAKLSLVMTEGDTAAIAPEPTGPCLDQPSRLAGAAEGELHYASDFVARRDGVDVLLVGHAQAPAASARIDVRLAVAGMARTFCAFAGAPAPAIPMTSAFVRAADTGSPAEPPGPRRVERAPSGEDDLAAARSAPAGQRLAALTSTATIEIMGVSRTAPVRTVRLPGLSARARWWPGGDADDVEVPLACDTLWIDADAGRLVLVWRGPLTLVRADPAEARLLAWVEHEAEPWEVAAIEALRVDGALSFAVESRDLEPGAAAPDPAELVLARHAVAWRAAREPELTLAEYAGVSAELAERREPAGEVLARYGLDEHRWAVEERAWLERLGQAAADGDASLALEYGALFVAAQDALARPEEASIVLDEYVALRARVETAEDPARALADRRTTLPEWLRLDRRFRASADQDPALDAEIERRVEAEVRRLELERDPSSRSPEGEERTTT